MSTGTGKAQGTRVHSPGHKAGRERTLPPHRKRSSVVHTSRPGSAKEAGPPLLLPPGLQHRGRELPATRSGRAGADLLLP